MEAFRAIIKGWLGKTLLGIIILIFGAFGLQALSSIVVRPKPALVINDDEITQQALDKIIAVQKQSMLAQMGEHADPKLLESPAVRQRVIDALIERTLLKQAGQKQGLAISEDFLKKNIMAMPQFQKEGKFSEEAFNLLVREYGFTPTQFFQELAADEQINQWKEGVGSSAFMTSTELKQLFDLERQTRSAVYIKLPANKYAASIQVSPQQVATYYKQHQKDFLTQEQGQFDFIQLSLSDYEKKVQVSDAEIESAYTQQKQDALKPEKEERRASHILLEVDPAHPEIAKNQLIEIKKRVQKGEDFSKLAQQYSKDPGSASQGGDLGFAGHGVFDPHFEVALFALKKPGDLSDIVQTSYGVHLIQLKEIKKPEMPAFAQLKDSLKQQLLAQKAENLYQDALSSVQQKAFEAGDLKALAQEFSLPIQHSSWITHSGPSAWSKAAGNDSVFANKKVINAAFSSTVLADQRNSDVIALDAQHSVVLHLAGHKPATAKPEAEVAGVIKDRLIHQQSLEKAMALGRQIIAQLRSGVPREKIAAQYGVTWSTPPFLKRGDPSIEPQLVQKIFALPKPKKSGAVVYDGIALNNMDFVVVGLMDVAIDQSPMKPQDLQQAQQFLEAQLGQKDFNYFLKYEKSKAKIEQR